MRFYIMFSSTVSAIVCVHSHLTDICIPSPSDRTSVYDIRLHCVCDQLLASQAANWNLSIGVSLGMAWPLRIPSDCI